MAAKVCILVLFLFSSPGYLQANGNSSRNDNTTTNTTGINALNLDLQNSPLFNYGSQLDNALDTSVDTPIVTLKQAIPYFGGSYKTLYISKDGIIGFEPGIRYTANVIWNEGIRNDRADKPFIAPFLHNGFDPVNMNRGEYQGNIYYRIINKDELEQTDNNYQYNRKTLNYLNAYVKKAVIGAPKDFEVTTAIIITWDKVTDQKDTNPDDCDNTVNSPCKSATFQAVIVSSQKESVAIFNYLTMDIPYHKTYQAGFNGGHGRGWFNVIPCHGACSASLNVSRVNSLPNMKGSDLEGRYVLDVGREVIIRGGCLPTELQAGMLEVYPSTVSMFGGEMLQVSGKCMPATSRIYCKFGVKEDSNVTQGAMINLMKGYCPVPILTTSEPILVQWSSDGHNWVAERTIEIALPYVQGNNEEVEERYRKDWYSKEAKEIVVTWKPSDFSDNNGAQVQVNLVGYKEHDSTKKVEFRHLTMLGETSNSNGKMTVNVDTHRCKTNCDAFDIGLLEVKLTSDYYGEATKRVAIRYGPIPLGWYVHEAMEESDGSDWSNKKCKSWYEREKQDITWLTKIPTCPCNMRQALADFGRWEPASACPIGTDVPCPYSHCVRAVTATSDASGNRCCYDKEGSLVYSQLKHQGSTPERSHAHGKSPFDTPNHVPEMSHWRNDIMPFYQCCVWNEFELCDIYNEVRPTPNCNTYEAPGIGMVSGDPHVTTFDGQEYQFGGQGDFWIVNTGPFLLQGRFEPIPNIWDIGRLGGSTTFKPTALTAIVLRGKGVYIEVSTAPKDSIIPRGVDIRVGPDRKFFLTKSTMRQDFRGYSIINNAERVTNNKHDNFTIRDANNVGINVVAANELLHLTVALPPEMKAEKNKMVGMGLMGMYDNHKGNDFVSSGHTMTSPGKNSKELYTNFAMSWAIDKQESLFAFHKGAWALDRYSPYFLYSKIPTGFQDAPTQSQISSLCSNNEACKWDYKITGNRDIASATLKAFKRITSLRLATAEQQNCGLPDVGMNAEVSSNDFSQDSKVTVTGCGPHMSFSGEASFECVTETVDTAKDNDRADYGQRHQIKVVDYITHWVPKPNHVCHKGAWWSKIAEMVTDSIVSTDTDDDTSNADMGMYIGIAVGAVALIVIIVVAIIVVKKRKGSKAETRQAPRPAKRRDNHGDDPAAGESMLSGTNRNPVYKPSDQKVRISSNV